MSQRIIKLNGSDQISQAAVVAAVDRLSTATQAHATQREQACARLKRALRLGTTRESLREAERERLDGESEPRRT